VAELKFLMSVLSHLSTYLMARKPLAETENRIFLVTQRGSEDRSRTQTSVCFTSHPDFLPSSIIAGEGKNIFGISRSLGESPSFYK